MRYRGIGMPKAKKKKVPVVEAVPEEAVEEEEPPEPPEPPSTPPKQPRVVQPQLPSKTILLKAQRRLRKLTAKTRKEVRMLRLGSLEKWALAQRVFEAKMNQLGKTLKRNKQYDPFEELQKAHKAELAFC